jgi:hypothetical protein
VDVGEPFHLDQHIPAHLLQNKLGSLIILTGEEALLRFRDVAALKSKINVQIF